MTRVVLGRWGGESSSESRHRELSRKQKKRKKTAISLKSEKVDKSKAKLKSNFASEQIKTPEFQNLLTEQNPDLNAAIRRMMLPDDVSVPAIDGGTANGQPPLQAHGVLSALQSGLEGDQAQARSRPKYADMENSSELSTFISKKDANNALKTLAAVLDEESTDKMLSCMVKANIPFQHSALADVMKMFNKKKNYQKTVTMFDQLERKYGMAHPTPPVWACLIEAQTRNGVGNVDEGLSLIKHLEKSGVVLLADMFNPVLKGLVMAGRHDEAFDTWVSMKVRGINPNLESYNIMVEQCEHRGQPERAFFLIDEMKLFEVKPDKRTFSRLLRACATAPMWVNGYQDIVFDALAQLEGQELMPDREVYNNLIYAFSKVGDGAAADFYLQEMKQKQISPSVTTYNHVFTAYANNQLVGARKYGQLGRYVRPEPPPDTERQALYKEAGFDVVNEELSKTFIKPDAPERGKRQKTNYEDLYEFDDEAQEDFENNLRVEVDAKRMRQRQALESREEKMKALESSSASTSARGIATSKVARALPSSMGAMDEDGNGDEMAKYADMMNPGMLGGDDDDMLSKIVSKMARNGNDKGSNFEKLMEQLNSEDDIDPSAFLSEEDKKEWEAFLGTTESSADADREITMEDLEEMEHGAGELGDDDNEDAASGDERSLMASGDDSGVDIEGADSLIDDDMMGKITSMLATMEAEGEEEEEGETVAFKTSQSGAVSEHSTADAFNTLNKLLGYLDDNSGGVALKDHYVSNNKSITGGELKLDDEGLVSTQEIDRLWSLVEFGRAPKPDYSKTLRYRRSNNIERALDLYQEMCEAEKLEPNQKTLAALIGVVGYATLHRKAEDLVEKFRTVHNVTADRYAYDAMIKMHVIRNDVDSALDAKNKLLEMGMVPNRESYGILIESLSSRSRTEDALLILEEAADNKIRIRDGFLRKLRLQCKRLGIIHPDLPPDSMAWVVDVKKAREKNKNKSKRNVQPIQSKMYNL